MLIDSHHHFWQYDPEEYPWINDQMSVLKQNFEPDTLQSLIEKAGVDQVVSVQARQTIEETDWLLKLAEENAFIPGVVGWLPLTSDEIQSLVERYSHSPKLKAVRHVVQDEDAETFLEQKKFNQGIEWLTEFRIVYDLLIFGHQLPATITFVDKHPEQFFVLDHIAKPSIDSREFDKAWEFNFRELAKRENVVCKFSGVVTEVRDPDWDLTTIQPYWEVALEAFGPSRLMVGTDWPVCLLKTDYVTWIQTVTMLASGLSVDEREQFFYKTAQEAYQL
ncbi:L-fuconolactone hydrolase [Planctomycetales bacterium 10988]|nr:L-fuconolactone hydrolase [Planctomycetales bacterium 10988]